MIISTVLIQAMIYLEYLLFYLQRNKKLAPWTVFYQTSVLFHKQLFIDKLIIQLNTHY